MKRFISVLLTLTLVMGLSSAVFATAGSTEVGSGGNTTVTGDGDVHYIDLKVLKVVLPTGNIFDFALDPQGLIALADGETKSLAELAAKAGGIVTPDDAVAIIINRSAVNVTVDVDFTLTTSGTIINKGDIDATAGDTAESVVNTGTTPNILLYAIPGTNNINIATVPNVPSTLGYPIGTSGLSFEYLLGAAEYDITKQVGGGYVGNPNDDTAKGTAITLGGLVNKNADWTGVTASLSAVFTVSAANPSGSVVTGTSGLVLPVAGDALPVAPPVPQIGFSSDTGTSVATVAKDFAFGFDGKTVKSVTANGTAITASTTHKYVADIPNNKITFTFASAASRTIIVTLSDNTTYTITIVTT